MPNAYCLVPNAYGLPLFCLQNAAEIENVLICTLQNSPMQTLQLQLQLFNNTTRRLGCGEARAKSV